MSLTRNRFYSFLIMSCVAGYAWLWYASTTASSTTVCLSKKITRIPCPSCGTTRSVAALFHGQFTAALYWNPLGLVVFLILLISPCWLLWDTLKRRQSLWNSYLQAEKILRKKSVAIPLIILVLANWIWNICKHL